MTIDADLYSQLTTHVGNSALVGTRVYPLKFPVGATFPLQVYTEIAAPTEQAADNTIGSNLSRFQIDNWAETFDDARSLSAQCRAALVVMGNDTVNVHEVTILDDRPGYDVESDLYRRIVEARIVWSQ